jgi:hypothetical protein
VLGLFQFLGDLFLPCRLLLGRVLDADQLLLQLGFHAGMARHRLLG